MSNILVLLSLFFLLAICPVIQQTSGYKNRQIVSSLSLHSFVSFCVCCCLISFGVFACLFLIVVTNVRSSNLSTSTFNQYCLQHVWIGKFISIYLNKKKKHGLSFIIIIVRKRWDENMVTPVCDSSMKTIRHSMEYWERKRRKQGWTNISSLVIQFHIVFSLFFFDIYTD
jgi:hypothetical protein